MQGFFFFVAKYTSEKTKTLVERIKARTGILKWKTRPHKYRFKYIFLIVAKHTNKETKSSVKRIKARTGISRIKKKKKKARPRQFRCKLQRVLFSFS